MVSGELLILGVRLCRSGRSNGEVSYISSIIDVYNDTNEVIVSLSIQIMALLAVEYSVFKTSEAWDNHQRQ